MKPNPVLSSMEQMQQLNKWQPLCDNDSKLNKKLNLCSGTRPRDMLCQLIPCELLHNCMKKIPFENICKN